MDGVNVTPNGLLYKHLHTQKKFEVGGQSSKTAKI